MLVHRHDPPDRFVVGTVGEPGQRTFFLQARTGRLVTSVSLEKEQAAILAERIAVLLDELVRTGDVSAADASAVGVDVDPLEQPLVEEFRVGTMTLSWDPQDERVVIEAFPVGQGEPPDVDSADPDAEVEALVEPEAEPDAEGVTEVFVVRLSPRTARAFAGRAESVISAGRPPCPFCGQPLDVSGHLCPRSNGYKRLNS
jgi:uncharacterized repeat protein (TIGR03847 family)